MMRSLWKLAGDTKVTFWSLTASAALFLIGSLYANGEFEFFDTLNETRIQDWAGAQLADRWSIAWWLPLLFLALFLLGLNTVACTAQRVTVLWPTRKGRSFGSFFRDLTPSIVHVLFAVVMAGHLVTITLGDWNRVELREGELADLDGAGTMATVESIDNDLFPPLKGQPRRIAQTNVTLSSNGEEITVRHGEPATHKGLHLILDRKRKRKHDSKPTEENCNKEKDYRLGKKAEATGPSLLVVNDPGIVIIFPAFILILVLMAWFFASRDNGARDGRRKEPIE